MPMDVSEVVALLARFVDLAKAIVGLIREVRGGDDEREGRKR